VLCANQITGTRGLTAEPVTGYLRVTGEQVSAWPRLNLDNRTGFRDGRTGPTRAADGREYIPEV